ncbi:MAG: PAS domain S-box protein [Rhodospirillales bacterium]|nr:PAS domain S-box protein [Rhodospirillales bacterium]
MVARLTERELRQVIDQAIDGMIVIDQLGTVLLYNAACERLFKYPAKDVLGKNVKLLMPQPHRDRHDAYVQNYVRTGHAKIIGVGRDVLGQKRDGSTFPMRLSVGELRGASGELLFVGTIHDLSERQRARERIEELQTELMRVSRASALGEMGSALAHELNQPLSAIVGFVEASAALIDDSDSSVPEQAREYVNKAVAQSHRAADVIRRLCDLTHRGDTDRTIEDINTLVRDTCALAALGSAAAGIEVSLELSQDLPPVLIDSIQIQQVVLNLVRNSMDALSASETRTIVVATAQRGGVVEVEVRDTGPGLTPEVEPRLFEPFVSSKPDGIGIGLSICRTIVEGHGGEIAAEARTGGGMTFRFSVPVYSEGSG